MLAYLRRLAFARCDDGASAVEYGLLVAAIAAVIVAIVFALGGIIENVFTETCDTIAQNTAPEGDNCEPPADGG